MDGMLLDNMLFEMLRRFRLMRFPTSSGISPDKWLYDRSRYIESEEICKRLLGILPASEL
jgi:lipid A disaccharide synthetase